MNMCFTKEPTVAEVEVRPVQGVVKGFISGDLVWGFSIVDVQALPEAV